MPGTVDLVQQHESPGELISFEVSGDARKLFDLDAISVFNGFDDGDVVLGLHLPLQVQQRAS